MSVSSINPEFYKASKPEDWTGRIDSDTDFEQFRYHQVVKCDSLFDLSSVTDVALLGFASDEGVRRNKGRIGASEGPESFRNAIGSLCWQGEEEGFLDVGNIFPKNGNLEVAQNELGKAIQVLLTQKKRPFVIGGGHETAYGHYLGIANYLKATNPDAKLGILNIDAHFDLRPHNGIPHSGSPFLQAHEHAQKNNLDLNYFVFGINPQNNTKALFKTAEELGVEFCTTQEVWGSNSDTLAKVQSFIGSRTHIYLTTCLDVFKAEVAPGVSAPAWHGIELNHALKVLELVKSSGKMLSMDVCELNPEYDLNNQTSKLAGMLFGEYIR